MTLKNGLRRANQSHIRTLYDFMQLCQRILDIKQNSLASPLNVDVVKSKL